jgi:hypothetical protein
MNPNEHSTPHALTPEQWRELASIESIAQDFGLFEAPDPAQALSECAYGAHFHFEPSMMPGYMGDLFVLVGDSIDEPMSVIRNRDGSLRLV